MTVAVQDQEIKRTGVGAVYTLAIFANGPGLASLSLTGGAPTPSTSESRGRSASPANRAFFHEQLDHSTL